jgi:hypothetical protein
LYRTPDGPMGCDNLARENPAVVERLRELALNWHKALPPGPVQPTAGRDAYPFPKGTR